MCKHRFEVQLLQDPPCQGAPQVSLTPAENGKISTQKSWHPWQICHRCCWDLWQFATDVIDTGGKFAASIVDTGGKFVTGVVDTSGAPWLLNISRIFTKIWNDQNVIFMGFGKMIHEKPEA
jgi:hypothetical protein